MDLNTTQTAKTTGIRAPVKQNADAKYHVVDVVKKLLSLFETESEISDESVVYLMSADAK